MYANSPPPRRGFQGVWIPASLWDNQDLGRTEMCLLAEIDSLATEESPCFASAEFLAVRMQMSAGGMRNMLSKLTQREFLLQLGSNGRTVWRCIHPLYTSNLGKYLAWLKNPKYEGKLDDVTKWLPREITKR